MGENEEDCCGMNVLWAAVGAAQCRGPTGQMQNRPWLGGSTGWSIILVAKVAGSVPRQGAYKKQPMDA